MPQSGVFGTWCLNFGLAFETQPREKQEAMPRKPMKADCFKDSSPPSPSQDAVDEHAPTKKAQHQNEALEDGSESQRRLSIYFPGSSSPETSDASHSKFARTAPFWKSGDVSGSHMFGVCFFCLRWELASVQSFRTQRKFFFFTDSGCTIM